MIIDQLAHVFAPWQTLYGDSKVIPAVTEAAHLLALLFGGGLAIAADRSTLRAVRRASQREIQLNELHDVHRPVLVALGILFITGGALAAADIKAFASMPVFWIKLGLVALLLVNGALLTQAEGQLRRADVIGKNADANAARLWRRLRFNSLCSVGLWSATLIAGAVLTNAA